MREEIWSPPRIRYVRNSGGALPALAELTLSQTLPFPPGWVLSGGARALSHSFLGQEQQGGHGELVACTFWWGHHTIPSTPAAGAATFTQALFARKTLLPSVCLSCALRDGSYMGREHPAAFLKCTIFPSKIRCTSSDAQGSRKVLLVASNGAKSEYKSSCLP